MLEEFLPHPEATAVLEGDIQRGLPPDIREVLLDVILAWANLDMATAFFVASLFGLSPDEGADKFGRKEIADKLRRASKALRESGNTNAAVKVGEIAEAYPDKALMRRRIAHSRCAGVRKSAPDRVIFLPFEREGPPGHLAVEIIHISKFAEAAAWADEAHTYFMQHADSAGFFNER